MSVVTGKHTIVLLLVLLLLVVGSYYYKHDCWNHMATGTGRRAQQAVLDGLAKEDEVQDG